VSSDTERQLAQSSIWLARIERGLQPQEGASLREWLQDPAQRDAIVAAAKLHHGPDIIAVLADMVPIGFGNPAKPIRKRIHPGNLALAVGVGVVIAVTPLLVIRRAMPGVIDSAHYRALDPPLPWGQQAYSTGVGETRTVTLADGTHLTLNSHTRVGVLFGVGSRLVTLQYGEAIFDIERPRERPFEIDAGGRHFQAPPARFDVRVITPQTVELTVLQGRVTVQGLPWHWPATPEEARLFDPSVFDDTVVGPLQAAYLQDATMARYSLTAANARVRVSWEPQHVVYVTP
jgi:ferric-dicitrate binding protein FerR (iron transport regulator)